MNILIIDDNPQITLLLSKILANKGHVIKSSNFFDDGVKILKKEKFDAIIVDAPMEGYEKLNVITALEKDEMLRTQKIILFTGLEIASSTITELKTKGLYSYLKKPMEAEKLIQEILSIPSTYNTELTERRKSEEQTKKKLENLRENLSSLKMKLNPTG